MSRILIGWELGAGLGHVVQTMAMAKALALRGHEVTLAVQRFDSFPPSLPERVQLVQAPVWPGLMRSYEGAPWKRAVTMIDILARMGLDRPRVLKHLVLAWDGLIAATRADLVIADYAPGLIVAAQERLPSIATGSGFQVPPVASSEALRIGGAEAGYDEAEMLDVIDADLREAGRQSLSGLADIFRCSLPLIASFRELDPYQRSLDTEFIAPAIGYRPSPAGQPGDEVFVYLNGPIRKSEAFWKGLVQSGHKIRTYLLDADDALAAMVAGHGVIVERQPVPWPLIVARSRIAVHHGAHGMMCALLLAGIPQICLPADLEKQLHSNVMAQNGLGIILDPDTTASDQLAEAVRTLHSDTEFIARARAAAPGFGRRVELPFETSISEAADALLASSQ